MSFERAFNLATRLSRRSKRPFYCAEWCGDWTVSNYPPKDKRVVVVGVPVGGLEEPRVVEAADWVTEQYRSPEPWGEFPPKVARQIQAAVHPDRAPPEAQQHMTEVAARINALFDNHKKEKPRGWAYPEEQQRRARERRRAVQNA
jgi:hypothetical protein